MKNGPFQGDLRPITSRAAGWSREAECQRPWPAAGTDTNARAHEIKRRARAVAGQVKGAAQQNFSNHDLPHGATLTRVLAMKMGANPSTSSGRAPGHLATVRC